MFSAPTATFQADTPTAPEAPAITIVIPTFNERENIPILLVNLAVALAGLAWEVIVVDDDSPDGTAQAVREIVRTEPRVRCLRRIGRRGLASAVIEGALAANGDAILVMDADFQHDESQIAAMYAQLIAEEADLVVATRYGAGGSVGDWSNARHRMSRFAGRCARLAVGSRTSDPMSGFFLVRREIVDRAAHRMTLQGYKILFDLITSAPEPLRIVELPYRFRGRRAGESKISLFVLSDFAFLLVEKLTRGLVPVRFSRFAAVGGVGLLFHLSILNALKLAGLAFLPAQLAATGGAVILNYTLNNIFTFRDRPRRSVGAWLGGLVLFVAACSIGTIANVGVAELAIVATDDWSLAGIAGAAMSAVFNFAISSKLVWRARRQRA